MPWVKLEDDWYDNPKLLDADLAVVGMWVLGLTYCARYLTDGHVKRRALLRLVPDAAEVERLAGELVERGTWDVVADGWQVHDYLDYQPSAEVVKQQRKQRQEAGRLGGKRSGEARASAFGSANGQASARTPTRPVPTPYSSLAQNQEGELPAVENAKKVREVRSQLRAVGE